MTTLPDFKRGDTYQLTCTYKGDGSTASSVTGYTITCQMRTASGALVADMEATLLTQSGATLGQFTIDPVTADTTAWPVGSHEVDIQIVDGDGVIRSTVTFTQPVVKDITR